MPNSQLYGNNERKEPGNARKHSAPEKMKIVFSCYFPCSPIGHKERTEDQRGPSKNSSGGGGYEAAIATERIGSSTAVHVSRWEPRETPCQTEKDRSPLPNSKRSSEKPPAKQEKVILKNDAPSWALGTRQLLDHSSCDAGFCNLVAESEALCGRQGAKFVTRQTLRPCTFQEQPKGGLGPSSALLPFLGGGFPYQNRLQKKGYPYSNLSTREPRG